MAHVPAYSLPRIYIRTDARGRVPYFDLPPLAATGHNGTYTYEDRTVAAGSLPPHSFDEHVLMLPIGQHPVRFRSQLNGRALTGFIEPERFRFLARGDSLATTWTAPLRGLFLTLSPALFTQVLGSEIDNRPVELVSNVMPHADPVLAHLLHVIHAYASHGGIAGKLFEQSLLTAIVAHVLVHYSSGHRSLAHGPSLPQWKFRKLETFIHEHLAQPLNLKALASVVDLSPYYLGRAFRAKTGTSLWQFVLECRAKEAQRLIASRPHTPLAIIAESCGFESYSQFIAAFRKVHAQLPSEFRRSLGSR